jgi:hypothetical protein
VFEKKCRCERPASLINIMKKMAARSLADLARMADVLGIWQ